MTILVGPIASWTDSTAALRVYLTVVAARRAWYRVLALVAQVPPGFRGVPGAAEASDQFGGALAMGDFNGGGRSDLAVGAAREGLTGKPQVGAVTILPGSPSGLTGSGSTSWTQDSAGVPDTAEANDQCGAALRAVPVRSSTRSDLVFGCPGEASSGQTGNGSIALLPSTASGLTGTGSQSFVGENLIGGGKTGARFGSSIG